MLGFAPSQRMGWGMNHRIEETGGTTGRARVNQPAGPREMRRERRNTAARRSAAATTSSAVDERRRGTGRASRGGGSGRRGAACASREASGGGGGRRGEGYRGVESAPDLPPK